MQQLASHGLFNVMIQAEGDTWIDDHHTNEDIGEQASLSRGSLITGNSYKACALLWPLQVHWIESVSSKPCLASILLQPFLDAGHAPVLSASAVS